MLSCPHCGSNAYGISLWTLHMHCDMCGVVHPPEQCSICNKIVLGDDDDPTLLWDEDHDNVCHVSCAKAIA